MLTPRQILEHAAADFEAREDELTPIWRLARSANVHKNHLLQVLKDRGFKIHYPEPDGPAKPPVPSITKADVRRLYGMDSE